MGLGVGEGQRTFADSDTVTPRLVSATRSSSSPISPPATIAVGFVATDDLNVARVTFIFDAPLGEEIRANVISGVNGVQVGSTATLSLTFSSIDQRDYGRLPAGAYTLTKVTVSDWSTPNPNELTCNRDGSAFVSSVAGTLPSSPCPGGAELAALDFVLENDNEDLNTATITSIIMPTGTKQPGDTLSVPYTATDGDGAGLSTLSIGWMNQSNTQQTIFFTQNHTGTLETVIGENVAPGVYTPFIVIIRDRMGYALQYLLDGEVFAFPADIISIAEPHPLTAAFGVTFTVVNPNVDTETPVLDSFERTSFSVLSPLDDVVIEFDATDNEGIQEIYFEYTPPSGLPFQVFDVSVTSDELVSEIPQAAVPGLYTLLIIRIIDDSGNEVRYFRGGGLAGIPNGVIAPLIQPPGMAAMFEQADFTIGSGPSINLLSLSPTMAVAGSGTPITLTVEGTGFTPTSVIHFGSQSLATQFNGPGDLEAELTVQALQGSARTVSVFVTTPFAPPFALRAPVLTFELVSAADVDCDGAVTLEDAIDMRRLLASLPTSPSACLPNMPGHLDANDSGQFEASDPLWVMKALAGLAE